MTATPHQDVVAANVAFHPWTLVFEQSSSRHITRILQANRLHVFGGIPRSAACSFPPSAFAVRSAVDPKAFFGAFPISDGDRWMSDAAHEQVPSVGYLHRLRRASASALDIDLATVAAHHAHLGLHPIYRTTDDGCSSAAL
jgi:hypothetical protein